MAKAKLQEMGLIMTQEAPDGHPPDNIYAYAIVIEFESRDALLKAINEGQVEFDH